MKTDVFFRYLFKIFILGMLGVVTAFGLSPREYGGLSCQNGARVCPPTADGTIRGDLIDFDASFNRKVYYQTNLKSRGIGSYTAFKQDPSFSGLVYGDYSVAGESILNFPTKPSNGEQMDRAEAEYENDAGFSLNSKKSSLYLPGDIKADYIKYARITWVGSIHSKNFTGTDLPKDLFAFRCTQEKEQIILKDDIKPLSAKWLQDICNRVVANKELYTVEYDQQQGRNIRRPADIDCSEIPDMVENGIYNPLRRSDYQINLNKYNEPGGYLTFRDRNGKFLPGSNEKPKVVFTCEGEKTVPMMKKEDLKPVSSSVISQCKEKFPGYDCDNILGGHENYFFHNKNYETPKNPRITLISNTFKTMIKKEDLSSRKISLYDMCRKQYGNSQGCEPFKNSFVYRPYTEEELKKSSVQGTKKEVVGVKAYSYKAPDNKALALKYPSKPTNTLAQIKEDCKKIEPQNSAYCEEITPETAGSLLGKSRLGGYVGATIDKPKYYFECTSTKGCGYINISDPGSGVGYKFDSLILDYPKSNYCDVHKDQCVEVDALEGDPIWSDGNENNSYCKMYPDRCVANVKTCKETSFGTDYKSYCQKNPDKCAKAKFCTAYEYTLGNRPPATNDKTNTIGAYARKQLNGYKNISLKVGNADVRNIEAKDEDVFYLLSLNTNQSIKDVNGTGGFRFIYSASADVTEYVKASLSSSISKNSGISKNGDHLLLDIIGGNVKASDGTVIKGATLWSLGREFMESSYTASFGSYLLTVVYDNKEASNSSEIANEKSNMFKFYRPKNVTIYNGFAGLSDDLNDPKGAYLDFDLRGFYTPMQDNYDAKATVYAASNANYFHKGDSMMVSYKGNQNDLKPLYNPLAKKHTFSGGKFIVKPGEDQITIEDSNMYRSISVNTFVLNRYSDKMAANEQRFMGQGQTDIHIRYGTKAFNKSAEQTYPSVIAFSTDLYVPNVCYYSTVYNKAGKSSRDKGGFVVNEGEVVKNQVYFTMDKNSRADDAHGLIAYVNLSKNISYMDNTMRIDNSFKNKGPNDFMERDLKYMKDNEKGLYDTEKFQNLTQKDKQFNKVSSKELNFYIGKGAGVVTGNDISGGSLVKKDDDKVYVEYKTRVNGYYEEPTFKYGFSLKGTTLPYRLTMSKCPTPSGEEWENIVEVTPIDGIKVVNKDYKDDNSYDGLYTQIANKPFDLKLSYGYSSGLGDISQEDINRILSDKEICRILGYSKEECADKDFIAKKTAEFNEKRKELQDAIKKLSDEINDLNTKIAKKEADRKVAENDKNQKEAAHNEAKAKLERANAKLEEAKAKDPQIASEVSLAEEEVKAAEKEVESAEKSFKAATAKLTKIDGELTGLKNDLGEVKQNKEKKISELGQTEQPIGGEFTKRIGRLDGKFETTLVTLTDLEERGNEQKCKTAKNNKDLHYSYYQDFNVGKRKRTVLGIETTSCINEKKLGLKCSDMKDDYKLVRSYKDSNAFTSYEYFTNEDKTDTLIDMNNVTIGYARPDYTFIVSYIPTGAALRSSCYQECVSRYSSEPSASKDRKIEQCKTDCNDKYKENEIDEKYLEEFRADVCSSDIFAVRPAYYALEREVENEIYNLGEDKLDIGFKNNIYPADENGNYVLGYDALQNPSDDGIADDKADEKTFVDIKNVRSTIFGTIVPKTCDLEGVKSIIEDKDGNVVYKEKREKIEEGDARLWTNMKNASNNLKVDFRFAKDGKDKNITERIFYNEKAQKEKLSSFKKSADTQKNYAKVSLGNLGKLNYYNIGYAKMRLTDSKWTKLDKPYIDKSSNSYNYVIDSKKNDRFGEFIGFKDRNLERLKNFVADDIVKEELIEQDLLLRFKHEKVITAINGIKDFYIKNDSVYGELPYTYFYSEPEMMGASLDITVTAASSKAEICKDIKSSSADGKCPSGYVQAEIYPTLYHSGCYARDVEFGLGFDFDCTTKADDERCKPLFADGKSCFKIIDGKIIDGEIDCDKCSFHSECYKPTEGSGVEKGIREGMVYYPMTYDDKGNLDDELMKRLQDENASMETYPTDDKDNKLPDGNIRITAQKDTFNNAVVNLPLKFNFKRYHNMPDKLDPKLIFATDFVEDKNTTFKEKPLQSDKSEYVVKNHGYLYTKGIESDKKIFKGYDPNKNPDNKDTNKGKNKATFYYGYINAKQTLYPYGEGNISVEVYPMVYYGAALKFSPQTTKFTKFAIENLPLVLNKNETDPKKISSPIIKGNIAGFFVNKAEFYSDLDDIKSDKFVKEYENSNVEGLDTRSAMENRDNMYEKLNLSLINDDTDEEYERVHVYVKPWFLYHEDANSPVEGAHNTFTIENENNATNKGGGGADWGGAGGTDDDIVGSYLDNKGKSYGAKPKGTKNMPNNAIRW